MIEQFGRDIERVVGAYYGITSDNIGRVRDMIRFRLTGHTPGAHRAEAEWCIEQKPFLQSVVREGVSIDAVSYVDLDTTIVVISHSPISPDQDVYNNEGKRVAVIHPARGERKERFEIDRNGFSLYLPDTQISLSDASAPDEDMQRHLLVTTTDTEFGIPGCMMTINAGDLDNHRHRICLTMLEDNPVNRENGLAYPFLVYGSRDLGVQAYYTAEGSLHSVGMYFKDLGGNTFGTWMADGERTAYKRVSSYQKDQPITTLPEITSDESQVTITRSGVKHHIPLHIDAQDMLRRVVEHTNEKAGLPLITL